jgi:RNA polymerase sigma factor (TIGR02999 family)
MLGVVSDVSRLLRAIDAGDPRAAADLLPLVYAELRRLAAVRLAREQPGQTLDATGLVHEAYLRLVSTPEYANRGHFFAAAAEAMRRILIDRARRKQCDRHGGGRRRVVLTDAAAAADDAPDDLLDLDAALTRFAAQEPTKAELVKLRFFAGLTAAEAATALSISVATAERWWTFARTWLYAELTDAGRTREKDTGR